MGTSVPDDNVAWDEEVAKVVDDSPGHLLDPNLMAKARQEELEWLRKEKVYERVPATGCQGKPLQLKWVDVSEGDHTAPKIRSHLVAKEIKRAKPLADQLGGADTFAATPPLESVYALMSSFMTRQQRGEACKMMTAWNVSIVLTSRASEACMGLKMPHRSYFQKDYQCWFRSQGADFSVPCQAVFRSKCLMGLVHGDDFLVVGSYDDLRWFDEILNAKCTARWEALLGKERSPRDVLSRSFGLLLPRWSGRR